MKLSDSKKSKEGFFLSLGLKIKDEYIEQAAELLFNQAKIKLEAELSEYQLIDIIGKTTASSCILNTIREFFYREEGYSSGLFVDLNPSYIRSNIEEIKINLEALLISEEESGIM